jgi:hypothetical protein
MGLGSSVFAAPGYSTAATPAAAGASPQGPTTIGQKAFGIVTGGTSSGCAHAALLSGGVLSIIGLVWIWYSLPR